MECEKIFYDDALVNDTGITDGSHSKNFSIDNETITLDNYCFKKNISFNSIHQKIRFRKCTFDAKLDFSSGKNNIIFEECDFNGPVEEPLNIQGGKIKKIFIENRILNEKAYFNKNSQKEVEIEELHIQSSIFKNNFKIHNAVIRHFDKMKDVDFEKNFDLLNCKLDSGSEICFSGVKFKGLAFFNHSHFKKQLIFNKVSFFENVSFIQAQFDAGIDLERMTPKKTINFAGATGLDSAASKHKTSRESYRIIKHNFRILDNQIDTNRYHTLELDAERRFIWDQDQITKEYLSDGIVSLIFCYTSYYGKYWILPLFWIFVVGFLTSSYLGEINLNNVLSYMSLSSSFPKNTPTFLSLINKGALGFLYYQFIMSVRKNTKKI